MYVIDLLQAGRDSLVLLKVKSLSRILRMINHSVNTPIGLTEVSHYVRWTLCHIEVLKNLKLQATENLDGKRTLYSPVEHKEHIYWKFVFNVQ